jgi:hypothetical protein
MAKQRRDAADASNAQVLADRQERIEAARPVLPDLGLGLQSSEPATATEFMDVFDKKAFGYEQATITKVIYGPDPLVDHSPSFREVLEKHGREDLAHLYEEAILAKGAAGVCDPLMQKSLAVAINKFGREEVAAAFRERVLKIPYRTVEIDASDELDPEILGSQVLTETIRHYERPGMCYRFFTQLCVDRMGWRGYTPVRENGNIVSAGTLMLGEIRRERAEARQLKQKAMAREKLDGIAESHAAAQEQVLQEASREGVKVAGVSALDPSDVLTAVRAGGEDAEGYLGRSRSAEVQIGRE